MTPKQRRRGIKRSRIHDDLAPGKGVAIGVAIGALLWLIIIWGYVWLHS